MKRTLFFSLACVLATAAMAQDSIAVARYLGGRKAAVSYTFDDGLKDQYTLAYPQLKKRGLRATFAVIGSKVGGVMHSSQDKAMGIDGTPCMTWDMLREMAAEGHEISSHGWEHKKVQRLTPEQLRHEVQHNDSVIFRETGQFPRTYFFPGNSRDSATLAYCMQGRVGCRTYQIAVGSKRDAAWLNRWVEGLVEKGEWGVGMTHGIAMGYDHFADPQVLWDHLDHVASMQDSVWVAPFCEVAAYVRERDDVSLSVGRRNKRLTVDVACTLPADLFTQPLTLVVGNVGATRVKRAVQKGKRLPVYERGGKRMVDFDPHGGQIVLW